MIPSLAHAPGQRESVQQVAHEATRLPRSQVSTGFHSLKRAFGMPAAIEVVHHRDHDHSPARRGARPDPLRRDQTRLGQPADPLDQQLRQRPHRLLDLHHQLRTLRPKNQSEEEPRPVRVLAAEDEVRLHNLDQGLDRTPPRLQDRTHRVSQHPHWHGQQRLGQTLLAAEMVVQGRLRHPRRLDNHPHRRRLVPLPGEQPRRHPRDLPRRCVQLTLGRCRCRHRAAPMAFRVETIHACVYRTVGILDRPAGWIKANLPNGRYFKMGNMDSRVVRSGTRIVCLQGRSPASSWRRRNRRVASTSRRMSVRGRESTTGSAALP